MDQPIAGETRLGPAAAGPRTRRRPPRIRAAEGQGGTGSARRPSPPQAAGEQGHRLAEPAPRAGSPSALGPGQVPGPSTCFVVSGWPSVPTARRAVAGAEVEPSEKKMGGGSPFRRLLPRYASAKPAAASWPGPGARRIRAWPAPGGPRPSGTIPCRVYRVPSVTTRPDQVCQAVGEVVVWPGRISGSWLKSASAPTRGPRRSTPAATAVGPVTGRPSPAGSGGLRPPARICDLPPPVDRM